ncbi:hypothetical protein LPB142_07155 [Rhodobacter xanthinilyticus]|uniref:Uncharacterized protein n=1 Tax=Rhodobacter xanthinilyticus TaxID=1850250 RepID=A0A1D9MBB2_9RHOB|nr:hypothetical protein LPB142_07155 [Rhodobacter xanthinilyticus]
MNSKWGVAFGNLIEGLSQLATVETWMLCSDINRGGEKSCTLICFSGVYQFQDVRQRPFSLFLRKQHPRESQHASSALRTVRLG